MNLIQQLKHNFNEVIPFEMKFFKTKNRIIHFKSVNIETQLLLLMLIKISCQDAYCEGDFSEYRPKRVY